MNIREDSTIRAPSGKDDICAKFTIDTVNEPFVLHDIAQVGQEYTLSFWCYSEADGEITAGGVDMSTSSDWTRYVVTFIAESVDVPIYFNIAGTYYLHNTQLEIGCKATDFALNPADTEEDVAALAVIVNSHTTQFTVMDGKIAGLIEENITIRGEYDTLVSRATEMQADLDGITTRVSMTETDLASVENRVTSAESQIIQHADEIALTVKEENITGDYLIGKINLDSTTAQIEARNIKLSATDVIHIINSGTTKIEASKLDLSGYVTVTSLASAGQTTINGANITTGLISADRIDVAALFTKEITATNLHVTGNSVFDGTLRATKGTIAGWDINSTSISTTNSSGNYIHLGNGSNTNQDVLVVRTGAGTTASPHSWPVIIRATGEAIFSNAKITGNITAKSLTAYDNVKVYDSASGKTHTALSAFYTSETSGVMLGNGSSEVRCATFFWSYGNILSNGSITASSSFKVGSTSYNDGWIELYGDTPFIDFHFKNSTADYTSRIIEESSGLLKFTHNVTVNGELKFTDYNGTSRRPISSASTDSNRVSYIASKKNSNGTYYITVQGQFGTTGSAYVAKNISTNTSDVRLKCNIVDTDVEALPVINQMAIRAFDWLESGIHRSIGFVADELEAIDPALAFGGGYDEYGDMIEKNVDVFYLAGYLTKGIQELYSAQVEMDERLVVVESWKESVEDQLMDAREEIVELRTELAEARNEIEQLKSQASAA